MTTGNKITVEVTVHVPLSRAWACWTEADHITGWNFASDDWTCPSALNDLRPGGEFVWRMEARDGSMGFDFGGRYDEVIPQRRIESTMGDGRKISIQFHALAGDKTRITESFDPENKNPVDLQRAGWQSILGNFKKYVEGYPGQ